MGRLFDWLADQVYAFNAWVVRTWRAFVAWIASWWDPFVKIFIIDKSDCSCFDDSSNGIVREDTISNDPHIRNRYK